MSEHEDETDDQDEGITDEMLPEDLRPTDDNPLAKPIDEAEADDVPGATEEE